MTCTTINIKDKIYDMNTNNGVFIAFEGIDGSGKSTQITLLKKHIEEHAINCIVTREPSDGPVGTLLRQFLTGRIQGDEATISALFTADRLDHLNNPVNGLCKLLEDGLAVLTDRYLLSNYAYQSVAVPLEWIMKCNTVASETLKPHCHIFIDVEPDIAIQRMSEGRHQTELFETKERLTDVRERYLDLIGRLGDENIIIVNGNRSVQEISDEIWAKVCHYFV
jgi:dTMP kinase